MSTKPLQIILILCGVAGMLGRLEKAAWSQISLINPTDVPVPEDSGETDVADLADVDQGEAAGAHDGSPIESELIQERYPSSAIKIERRVILDAEENYINHGDWMMWDEKGNLVARGRYDHGKRDGTWLRWYSPRKAEILASPIYKGFEAPFHGEVELNQGRLDGAWTIYDAKDRIASRWMFKSGARHGPSLWWSPNGQKRREVHFEDGQLVGESTEWTENGEIARQVTYVDHRELAEIADWYDPAPKRGRKTAAPQRAKYRGWMLHDRRIANPTFDWWNGIVKMPAAKPVAEPLRHGRWKFWYPSGLEAAQGEYDLGRLVGKWEWWHPNGQLRSIGQFSEGISDGEWTWWHSNGQKHRVGAYKNGVEIGVWREWREDGKIVQVKDASAGGMEPSLANEEPADEIQRQSRRREAAVRHLEFH